MKKSGMKVGAAVRSVTVASTGQEALLKMERLIPQAKSGDYDATRLLLFLLSEAVRQGARLTAGHADFLSRALRDIADGKDPKKAFHIRRSRGQRGGFQAGDDQLLRACAVSELLRGQKMSLIKSIRLVAEKWGVSQDTISDDWKRYRKYIEQRPEGGQFINGAPPKRTRGRRSG